MADPGAFIKNGRLEFIHICRFDKDDLAEVRLNHPKMTELASRANYQKRHIARRCDARGDRAHDCALEAPVAV